MNRRKIVKRMLFNQLLAGMIAGLIIFTSYVEFSVYYGFVVLACTPLIAVAVNGWDLVYDKA